MRHSDAAVYRDLADQYQRLAAFFEEGAELFGEFGGLLKKRDAQVELLRGHIAIDLKLFEQIQ